VTKSIFKNCGLNKRDRTTEEQTTNISAKPETSAISVMMSYTVRERLYFLFESWKSDTKIMFGTSKFRTLGSLFSVVKY
jgi:hypothetical protein